MLITAEPGLSPSRPSKSFFLGIEIIFHRLVIIEMVLRQIGKYRDLETAANRSGAGRSPATTSP